MPKGILQMKVTSQVVALRYAAYLGECNLIMWAFFFFLSSGFLWLVAEAYVREIRKVRRSQHERELLTWDGDGHVVWEYALANSQQENRDLSLTAKRKCILLTTWQSLEAGSSQSLHKETHRGWHPDSSLVLFAICFVSDTLYQTGLLSFPTYS